MFNVAASRERAIDRREVIHRRHAVGQEVVNCLGASMEQHLAIRNFRRAVGRVFAATRALRRPAGAACAITFAFLLLAGAFVEFSDADSLILSKVFCWDSRQSFARVEVYR